MSSSFTIRGSKELLLVAERIAIDKGISYESVLKAMADGIKMAAKKKYGTNLDVDCVNYNKTVEIFHFKKRERITGLEPAT